MDTLTITTGLEWDRDVSVAVIFVRDVVFGFLGRILDVEDAERLSAKVLAERTLVERAVEGDSAAFVALYDQNVNRIYKHVFFRVHSQVEAEDITQETFVKAWKAIGKYRISNAPFVAWLFTIAHNVTIDHYDKMQKATLVREAVEEECPTTVEQSPEDLMMDQFDNSRVREAVLKLKGDKKKVVLMRFIDDFSYAEISEKLHKTEGAIRVIQFRALSDLKNILTHLL